MIYEDLNQLIRIFKQLNSVVYHYDDLIEHKHFDQTVILDEYQKVTSSYDTYLQTGQFGFDLTDPGLYLRLSRVYDPDFVRQFAYRLIPNHQYLDEPHFKRMIEILYLRK